MTDYFVPGIVVFILLYGIFKKVNVWESFLSGAKEGILTVWSILPTLIAVTVCIGMCRASGAVSLLVSLFSAPAKLLHYPPEVLPLAFLRPISGSGSLVVLEDIFKTYGTDSTIGKVASVLQSSSETTFYTISVYYAATSVKKTGATLFYSLSGDIACFLFSAMWVSLLL